MCDYQAQGGPSFEDSAGPKQSEERMRKIVAYAGSDTANLENLNGVDIEYARILSGNEKEAILMTEIYTKESTAIKVSAAGIFARK